jgi:hypothetical protein
VPFDDFGGSVSIELVAGIDETLDGSNVYVIDRGEVKDHGAEGGAVVIEVDGLAPAGAGIIPGTVLEASTRD